MKISRSLLKMVMCSGILLISGCSTFERIGGDIVELGDALGFSLLQDILTREKIDEDLRIARAAGTPLTDPARRQDLEKIYGMISKTTKATKYSDNRIKIHSDGSLTGSNDRSELDFFIRAAAETLHEGYDGFVVVHLDYYKAGPQFFSLTPNLNLSSERWIGTYEGFLKHRNEQNMFDTRSGISRKVRQGVILMVKDEDFPNRDRFDAWQIYSNLIEARYAL